MAVRPTIDEGLCTGLDLQLVDSDASDIVSLENVKSFIRVDFPDDDYIISLMIDSAISHIERYCQISLRSKTYIATYDTISNSFEIPFGPIQSVDSVTDAALTPIPYKLKNSPFSRIMIGGVTRGEISPSPLPVIISYKAGYLKGAVPAPIIQAILKIVSTAYDLRADFEVIRGALIEYSNDSKSLLSQYRRKIFF